MPPDEPQSLEDLLDAAGRTVQPTHPGWHQLPQRLAQTPQQTPWRRSRRWWTGPLLLTAAAALLAFYWFGGFFGLEPTPREALAGPIEIRRLDVELTVLSVPETDDDTLYMPLLQKVGHYLTGSPGLAAAQALAEMKSPYLDNDPSQPSRKVIGQALVKDHRLVLNLQAGDNVVRFTDVAATIDPTSVRFVSNTDPAGTQVVEQNFEYDLASADGLLRRYLDRPIVCVARDGQETAGYLVSYDDKAIVLASEPTPPSPPTPLPRGKRGRGEGERKPRNTQSLARGDLQAIRLNEVPADLLVKPTLVWKLRTNLPGKHDTTLTYLCGFLQWQADYVVVVTPGEGVEPDLLDVTGWVSLENTSGTTYPQAGLKLIAGDVNRKRDPWAPRPKRREVFDEWMYEWGKMPAKPGDGGSGPIKEFVEKSFFEYHLYTLSAPSTVRDRQVKQLNLLRRTDVKAGRRYVFEPTANGPQTVGVELTVKNDKANGLGSPLPKGRVTLEQRDVDGDTSLIGRLDIDHTAVKEELTLKYGRAFDVTGEYRELNYEQVTRLHHVVTRELRVRNLKATAIQVRAVARLGTHWTLRKASWPHQPHDFETVYFDFPLQPNAEQVITYTVDYHFEGAAP